RPVRRGSGRWAPRRYRREDRPGGAAPASVRPARRCPAGRPAWRPPAAPARCQVVAPKAVIRQTQLLLLGRCRGQQVLSPPQADSALCKASTHSFGIIISSERARVTLTANTESPLFPVSPGLEKGVHGIGQVSIVAHHRDHPPFVQR